MSSLGLVVALPETPADPMGADGSACVPSHRADRIIAIKLVGQQLTLDRTDGTAYPETLQLSKQ